ncbi:STAS domain-containing protein [Streptomyces sp. GC420]|uniref:STAS domain-containing protein n=1 Tax=Streptomyces sp. GC420 TaxID=2697568 RepID=UPI001414DC94|nr:STAS domain-containing protein [Streptomyces sp. GC420]NBM16926.1 anti-sigma factor antagonist [Streptomyces sp. GC420]
MSELTTTVRDTATGPVLDIDGDLDFDTAAEFRAVLEAMTPPPAPGRLLVLNLAGLRFCDSSGITSLLVARNLAESAGAGVCLAAVPDHTARILQIIGLDQVFPIYADADAATRAAAAGENGPGPALPGEAAPL